MGDSVDKDQIVEVIPCKTAEEFIRKLTLTDEKWHGVDIGKRTSWIFRGQCNASPHWNLKPTSWRTDDNADMKKFRGSVFFSNYDGYRQDLEREFISPKTGQQLEGFEKDRVIEVLISFYAEYLVIDQFYGQAMRVGHHLPPFRLYETVRRKLPDAVNALSNYYSEIKRERRRNRQYPGRGRLSSDPTVDEVKKIVDEVEKKVYRFRLNEFPLLALGQHHGIPTSLLDWTLNPFVAAYFAAESPDDENGSVAVWALNQDFFPQEGYHKQEDDIPLLRFFTPPSSDYFSYFHRQHGLFTYVPPPTYAFRGVHPIVHFIEHGEWPDLVGYLTDCIEYAHLNYWLAHGPILRKLVLPSSECGGVLDYLDNIRMVRSTLMPTLDNVAVDLKRIRWKLEDY